MRLQYMYQDPLEFAQRDPVHFDTIWNILRGPRNQ